MTRIFEIWSEGYSGHADEGAGGQARKFGEVPADTFQQACDTFCSSEEWQKRNGNYDPSRLTVWGRRLFDNETDARRTFG